MKGNLKIRICEAKLYRDVENVGKMDPYCLLTYEKQKEKTKVLTDAGKFPKFNEDFILKSIVLGTTFRIQVYDKGTISDDIVCQNVFEISKNWVFLNEAIWFPLVHDNGLAGEILCEVEIELEPQFIESFNKEAQNDLQNLKNIVENINKGVQTELPKPLFIRPQAKKGINMDKEEEKVKKNELKDLQEDLKKWNEKKLTKQNDQNEMIRKMTVSHIVKDQLNKHLEQLQRYINDFTRRDTVGSIIVKVISAELKKETDPFVIIRVGDQIKRTKLQDEDKENPRWNEILKFEKFSEKEEMVYAYICDERDNQNIFGITGISIYSMIHSKLNEKIELELNSENGIIGLLRLQISFEHKK